MFGGSFANNNNQVFGGAFAYNNNRAFGETTIIDTSTPLSSTTSLVDVTDTASNNSDCKCSGCVFVSFKDLESTNFFWLLIDWPINQVYKTMEQSSALIKSEYCPLCTSMGYNNINKQVTCDKNKPQHDAVFVNMPGRIGHCNGKDGCFDIGGCNNACGNPNCNSCSAKKLKFRFRLNFKYDKTDGRPVVVESVLINIVNTCTITYDCYVYNNGWANPSTRSKKEAKHYRKQWLRDELVKIMDIMYKQMYKTLDHGNFKLTDVKLTID